MAEYIEREAFIESQQHLYCENCARRKDGKGKFVYDIGDAPCMACGIMDVLDAVEDFPAADVLPRDEAIKMGAELAAMHGATPEQQQLEEAYLKGVEYGMKRRDVRPVVKAKWDDKPVAFFLKCTECGCCVGHRYDVFLDRGELNFCPNCGAMMEES